MKTAEEINSILKESRKFNIWANPNRKSNTDGCEYCGKKTGENPLYVHVTYVGTCVPNDVTEEELENVEQSQGCWPIGSECAKHLFGDQIAKYTKKD